MNKIFGLLREALFPSTTSLTHTKQQTFTYNHLLTLLLLRTKPYHKMMLARSLSNSRTAGAIRTGLTSQKRVRFANDHPDLMKPRATDKFIFTKNGLVSDFVHQKAEPVTQRRPRRLRFGKGRSLAEMAETQPESAPRSIKVTAERVNPADILRNKVPASPAYNPTTAASNFKKMWEQFEMEALNKASRAHYQLIRKRSELMGMVHQMPTGESNPQIVHKISLIDEQMQELKTEMNQRRQNMLCLEDF